MTEVSEKIKEALENRAVEEEKTERDRLDQAAASVVSQIVFNNDQKIVVVDHVFPGLNQVGSVVNDSDAMNKLFSAGWRMVSSEKVCYHYDPNADRIHVIILYNLVMQPQAEDTALILPARVLGAKTSSQVDRDAKAAIVSKIVENTAPEELAKLSAKERAQLDEINGTKTSG